MNKPFEKKAWIMVQKNPGSAALNLAIENHVLQSTQNSSDVILFLYINNNSVVIGKFQNPWIECNIPWLESEHIPICRRISGGGTVWHDKGNLNWSFIGPRSNFKKTENLEFISGVLRDYGLAIEQNNRGDLLLHGKKVSGNALRFEGNRVLHHGTLLVNANPEYLQKALDTSWHKDLEFSTPAVSSVKMNVCNLSDHIKALEVSALKTRISKAFVDRTNAHEYFLDPDNIINEAILEDRKTFESVDWTWKRSPPFSIVMQNNLEHPISVEAGQVIPSYTKSTEQDLSFDKWLRQNKYLC